MSTVGDLAVFVESLFTTSEFPHPDYKDEFLGELLPKNEDFYGLGIMKYPTEYGTGYGNGGRFCGYESGMIYFPSHFVTIVYFANSTGGRLDRVLDDLFDRILKKAFSKKGQVDFLAEPFRTARIGDMNTGS